MAKIAPLVGLVVTVGRALTITAIELVAFAPRLSVATAEIAYVPAANKRNGYFFATTR